MGEGLPHTLFDSNFFTPKKNQGGTKGGAGFCNMAAPAVTTRWPQRNGHPSPTPTVGPRPLGTT